VAEGDKSEVETALADAKTTLTGVPSATELNAAKERLTSASHKLAEAMYKAAAAAPPPADAPHAETNGAADAKKDESVIDAEYVDVEK
jgi:molecular chaperone DnaK